ncbi:hypothetical protein LCGC14_1478330 [marine sediment metagenome]|uniref:Uncharacterized protein n=1 Tax=marine sediment metagenome TaxID=412755 RepID=A0A0F9LQM2_9ZZZZ
MQRTHPLSKEEGWRASRRRWRDEARAILRHFPKVKENKIIYDYGLARIVRAEHKAGKSETSVLWYEIRKWLTGRGYDLIEGGACECRSFRVEIWLTQTRLVLKIICRRTDEVCNVPIHYKITQANYVENCIDNLKGRVYRDSMGREEQWTGADHERRVLRDYHRGVVKRALRAGLKVTKKVLKDYPGLEERCR